MRLIVFCATKFYNKTCLLMAVAGTNILMPYHTRKVNEPHMQMCTHKWNKQALNFQEKF